MKNYILILIISACWTKPILKVILHPLGAAGVCNAHHRYQTKRRKHISHGGLALIGEMARVCGLDTLVAPHDPEKSVQMEARDIPHAGRTHAP